MTFSQKLKTLRKEHNYSQEDLAEILTVSRQAVSKWESDRGIPEIDKILQISNIFGVTLDYLLKEDSLEDNNQSDLSYVSRERLEGFLVYKRKCARRIAIGISLILLSNVFSDILNQGNSALIAYWLTFSLGTAVLIWHFFQPKRYGEIGTKILLYDETALLDFRKKHEKNRKLYLFMIILAFFIFILGTQIIPITSEYFEAGFSLSLTWVLHAVWVSIAILSGISFHAESVIAQNTAYMQKKMHRGKYRWLYFALPVTALATVLGVFTNAWNPILPVLVLLCVLLVSLCKILTESRNSQ